MSELKIVREFSPEDRLIVPEEIKAMYKDGTFSFANPNHPGFASKVSPDSGVEIVKVTDKEIKAKYNLCIEPGTNYYRIGDAILIVQHIETRKAKDKYIEKLVDRKLPKVIKKNKDDFAQSNKFASAGTVKTETTVLVERDGKTEKMSV